MPSFEDFTQLTSQMDLPDSFSRKYVGLRNNTPFIKGYWHLFIDPPQYLVDKLKYNPDVIEHLLAGTSVNFTPPNSTLNKADMPHMGGNSKYITGRMKNNDFSITYNELSGSPVFAFHQAWAQIIADNITGARTTNIPKETKATFLVVQTKPLGSFVVDDSYKITPDMVERVYVLHGVLPPDDDQLGNFDSDITSQSLLQLSISYTCDDWFTDFDYPELKNIGAALVTARAQSSKELKISDIAQSAFYNINAFNKPSGG